MKGNKSVAGFHVTFADAQPVAFAAEGVGTSLRHGPASATRAVQRDVECAVVFCRGGGMASLCGVVGREHATDEHDDGEPKVAIAAQGIKIPPAVTVDRHGGIEVRKVRIVRAQGVGCGWCHTHYLSWVD